MSAAAGKKEKKEVEILDTEEREEAVWCPERQIYVGGVVPSSSAGAEVEKLVEDGNGCLRVFGYGSLCWNPGNPETSALAHPTVNNVLGRAKGYRRCWSQRSADHRGTPSFPGIVCTLLADAEYRELVKKGGCGDMDENEQEEEEEESLTEGLLYEVPPELVDECLAELDFREKGVSCRNV